MSKEVLPLLFRLPLAESLDITAISYPLERLTEDYVLWPADLQINFTCKSGTVDDSSDST